MTCAPLRIDGSRGEGGGQILRTALTLSLLTRRAVRLENIRAGRDKPGLRPQHLKAVEAAAAIGGARVQGARLGAQMLEFSPQGLFPGRYQFAIGTAGATGLVLQTLFYPLAFLPSESHLSIEGGTHVPWSPCFHFLKRHWLPFMQEMGFEGELDLVKAGYYPQGGGLLKASIRPVRALRPVQVVQRGNLERIHCLSMVTNLSQSIAERQAEQALQRLSSFKNIVETEVRSVAGTGKGTMLLILGEFEGARCCHFALGQRGKPAEQVADEAVDAFENFLRRRAAIDEYLADQILIPLALADGVSEFTTSRVTRHLLTNIETVQTFLPVRIRLDGRVDEPGRVLIEGRGAAAAY